MIKLPDSIMDQSDIQDFCDRYELEKKNIKKAEIAYLVSLMASTWDTYEEMKTREKVKQKLVRSDPDKKYLISDTLNEMVKLNVMILNGNKSLRKPHLDLLYKREEELKKLDITGKQFNKELVTWIYAASFFTSRLTNEVRKKYNCKDRTNEFDPEKYGNPPELIEAMIIIKSVSVTEAFGQRIEKHLRERDAAKEAKVSSNGNER